MRLEAQNPNIATGEELTSVAAGIANNNPAVSSLPNNIKGSINNFPNVVQNASSSSSGQYLHNGPVKMPINITNITTSHQITDTLHHRSKPIGCNNHACIGSIMAGQTKHGLNMRNNEEVLDQAIEFLEQYFIYLKKSSSDGLAQRMAEIATEIDRTGTYTLTTDELHFGAKTAWRNAARCIGRIQWNKLELQDARHVKTTSEMFEALCRHIRDATNDGNLRSMITVFPQRIHGRDDFRVWNTQLIGFAGYLQPDGSVIGDPGRVQFTRICQRLGWKGKNGRFDILPIVVSAPGEGAKYYEIPEELILTVKIEHPNYSWFEELDLKWYALPAVSEMMLDCGGLQFTGAPFNGWYMGTEIGARDFCDPQRYNLTENVAKKMGLDVSNLTTLWKDKVLVEMNIAVLYSFQKSGVTIVDHHSASESFIKHMQTEAKQRGGCPADWVWIVPPISGSITSVFHQEMLNYNLRPSLEYQDKAWKCYKWPNSEIKLKHKFISVSKAALWSVMLMAKVLLKRVKATIIYASETGKSETFAQKLSKLMQMSFLTNVQSMEDYDFDGITKESFLIIVTSTFGNGEAPDNGKEFWKKLYKLNHSENKDSESLSNLKYAVFALGSTQYPAFCAFGKNIDQTLQSLGATQLFPIGLGDELRGQEQAFHSWSHDCYKISCKAFQLDIDENQLLIANLEEKSYDHKKVRISEVFIEPNEHQVQHELARLHHKKILPLKVIARVRLQSRQSERQTLLVRLSPSNTIAKNMFHYEPGDHLGVFPANPKQIVNALLGHLSRNGYNDSDSTILQVQHLVDGKWIPDSRLPCCSLRVALTNYLDITTPPNQQFLQYLMDMANDNWDSFRLKKLSNDFDDYEKWRSYNYPNMADVLNEFPSVHVDPEFLLTQLPLLQPRYYSISSSLKVNPDELHLTMGVVSYKIHDGSGPKRFGVCTTYFDNFPEEDIPCFLRSAPSFRLPENKKIPVIMVGAGSGIAPFRSFWQERDAQVQNGDDCGKMFLFFGCRNSKLDNIYGPELNSLLRKGVLHELFLAISRETGIKKSITNYSSNFMCNVTSDYIRKIIPRLMKCLRLSTFGEYNLTPIVHNCRYVQDQIFKQRALLHWLLTHERAHIYVCGDSLMADGVKKSFIKVMESEAKMKEKEAQEFFDVLLNQGRYHEDVFGVVHK